MSGCSRRDGKSPIRRAQNHRRSSGDRSPTNKQERSPTDRNQRYHRNHELSRYNETSQHEAYQSQDKGRHFRNERGHRHQDGVYYSREKIEKADQRGQRNMDPIARFYESSSQSSDFESNVRRPRVLPATPKSKQLPLKDELASGQGHMSRSRERKTPGMKEQKELLPQNQRSLSADDVYVLQAAGNASRDSSLSNDHRPRSIDRAAPSNIRRKLFFLRYTTPTQDNHRSTSRDRTVNDNSTNGPYGHQQFQEHVPRSHERGHHNKHRPRSLEPTNARVSDDYRSPRMHRRSSSANQVDQIQTFSPYDDSLQDECLTGRGRMRGDMFDDYSSDYSLEKYRHGTSIFNGSDAMSTDTEVKLKKSKWKFRKKKTLIWMANAKTGKLKSIFSSQIPPSVSPSRGEKKSVRPGAPSEPNEYNFNYKRRGLFIIINNKNFQPNTSQQSREGTDVDAERLEERFQDLGFEVKRYDDVTRSRMSTIMYDAAACDHSDADCFGCAILSHGVEGRVYAIDGYISLEVLITPFKGDRCPTLVGKPKLFYVQACRGSKMDYGADVSDSSVSSKDDVEVDASNCVSIRRIPIEADFLFAYSTVPGYYSWRNNQDGSWFIQALCIVLENYGTKMELLHMLTHVNRIVAYEFASCTDREFTDKMKQMPCVVSMLTRYVYFRHKKQDIR